MPGKSHEPASMPKEPSAIPPLPFYPNLRRALRSHGAAVLLAYLECRYPAPQDDPNATVEIDFCRTLVDLQLSARAFYRYSSYLAARHPSPAARCAAQWAGREFTTTQRHHSGTIKPYSFTRTQPGRISVRRCWPRLANLLIGCGITGKISEQIGEHNPLNFDRYREFCEQNAKSIVASRLESPEEAARAFGKRLHQFTLGENRKIAFAHRRPWTLERRARFEATMNRKRGK